MLTRRYILSLLLVTLLFLSGCASMKYAFTEYGMAYKEAETAYAAGNLDGAVRNLVVALSAKPDYTEAGVLLREIAPKAYEMHENRAQGYTNWDSVIAEYADLLALAENVASLGGNYPTIDAQSIKQKRDYAVQKAAEAHYSQGIALMEAGRYKEAAAEFKETQHFVLGYKDAEALYSASRTAAIKKIAIIPFENATGETKFGDMGTLLVDRAIGTAINTSPELVDFITRDHLDRLMTEHNTGKVADIQRNPSGIGKTLGVHSFVFGKVKSLVVDYSPRTSKTDERVTTIYREADAGGSYKVAATITNYAEKGEVTISIEFQVVSVASGSTMKTKTLEASATSEITWARFKGDRRALNKEELELCAQEEGIPASPEILVDSAIGYLSDDLAEVLVDFIE